MKRVHAILLAAALGGVAAGNAFAANRSNEKWPMGGPANCATMTSENNCSKTAQSSASSAKRSSAKKPAKSTRSRR